MDHPDYTQYLSEGVRVFTNESEIHKADMVVFHAPSLTTTNDKLITLKKKVNQRWVFWSLECEAHYPRFEEPAFRDLFEISATYSLSSDIPMPYIENIDPYNWRQAPAAKNKLINAFISEKKDKSGRIAFLTEMMSYLKVDSYGKVLNNISIKNDTGVRSKEQIISQYKFSIAFENSIAIDYVTEKFFQPLVMGSVPVYLGAPNVNEFAPSEKCYLDVNNFKSSRDLAEYITFLDQNDEEYNKLLAWKREPFLPSFTSKINIIRGALIDRLIRYERNLPIK